MACNDCGKQGPGHGDMPYICEPCLERRAEEVERAMDRLLDVEWLTKVMFHSRLKRERGASDREIAQYIIAEAKGDTQ